MPYQLIDVPACGEKITIDRGQLHVPDRPIIPFIEGDGTGPDIWRAAVRVFDAAVQKAYGGSNEIVWMEVFAGGKAFEKFGEQAWGIINVEYKRAQCLRCGGKFESATGEVLSW